MKVTFDPDICAHASICVDTLPSVFKIVDDEFVIDPSGADEATIRDVVAACPSGALKIVEDGADQDA
jgi:uncharacterized Fe-S cluster protein YjdI